MVHTFNISCHLLGNKKVIGALIGGAGAHVPLLSPPVQRQAIGHLSLAGSIRKPELWYSEQR